MLLERQDRVAYDVISRQMNLIQTRLQRMANLTSANPGEARNLQQTASRLTRRSQELEAQRLLPSTPIRVSLLQQARAAEAQIRVLQARLDRLGRQVPQNARQARLIQQAMASARAQLQLQVDRRDQNERISASPTSLFDVSSFPFLGR